MRKVKYTEKLGKELAAMAKAKNKYKVDKETWTDFGPLGQRMYNDMMDYTVGNRKKIDCETFPKGTWAGTCHNFAWLAVQQINGNL